MGYEKFLSKTIISKAKINLRNTWSLNNPFSLEIGTKMTRGVIFFNFDFKTAIPRKLLLFLKNCQQFQVKKTNCSLFYLKVGTKKCL